MMRASKANRASAVSQSDRPKGDGKKDKYQPRTKLIGVWVTTLSSRALVSATQVTQQQLHAAIALKRDAAPSQSGGASWTGWLSGIGRILAQEKGRDHPG